MVKVKTRGNQLAYDEQLLWGRKLGGARSGESQKKRG